MKVLKDGDDVEWKCEITCKSCNSELEIDAADIRFRLDEGWIGEYYIICPNCKYEMVIYNTNDYDKNILYIPPHIKKKAQVKT